MVYAGRSKDSGKVGKIEHGAVVRGMPEDNWLRLEDGSGFTKIVHEEAGTLLREETADSSAPVGTAPLGTDNFLEQKFMAIFKQFDTDGNGKMDMEEMKKLMKMLHARITDGDVEAMAKEADANKDGVLDLKEFIHWLFTGQTVKPIDRTEDQSGTYKKDLGTMTGAFRMLSLKEKFGAYEGEDDIPDSVKEKFREVWDTARKVGNDHPDDFMSEKQMKEFLQTWTMGGVKFASPWGERDAEAAIEDMWYGPGFQYVKASGDKAMAATKRRGIGEKEWAVIDFPAFIKWLECLSEDAIYPDPTVDVIDVMHFEDIPSELPRFKVETMSDEEDDY